MSLTFWDTVRGCNLADTLIKYLPKLAKDKKQTCIWAKSKAEALEIIENSVNRLGKKFISFLEADFAESPYLSDYRYLIILE